MVTQLAAIVSEKEQGLVTALRHMGLLQSSYWSSWVLFDLLMGLLTALSIVICGEFEAQLSLRTEALAGSTESFWQCIKNIDQLMSCSIPDGSFEGML